MKYLMNAFKSVAQQATQSRAATRHGIVTSYDPKTYAVKVQLQPEGVLTGWIPLKSAWVGNGWGLFCPPSIGDAIEIDFQEDDGGNGCAGWRFYNAVERPLPCPSGEFWLVHRKGAQLKFRNDGTVELRATQDLNIQANSDVHLDVSGTLQSRASQWNHKGPVSIDGALHVTQAITGQGGMTVSGGSGAEVEGSLRVRNGDVIADGISLKGHTHGGVEPGGGQTGAPQ
ncbi:Putative phage-related baseplate assembly protein V [Candidatus Glomeribacter gigasporarum BEG34]|uniref:Putative phage-related baseplate assembly protein V n=1 Tax=Candidatus Glomeribacter gigasporarum BEG34 TaxID=1070319 RepID=G2JAY8_9BURK|nr:phage baseplate assembly protein [Candidatus Glomeribacter gigasporarum]CCD29940.1 Putative phage-related baseplate assembly protein V [Candidatus Glomeribacter gigasporarum BEG34]